MSALSKILRDAVNLDGTKMLSFMCPGCKSPHAVSVSGDYAWEWNGSVDKPTFTQSVLIRSGHYIPGSNQQSCWFAYNAERQDKTPDFECSSCHSFVTDGKIQFLSDCTHELAGQTVDMPEWE